MFRLQGSHFNFNVKVLISLKNSRLTNDFTQCENYLGELHCMKSTLFYLASI